MCPLCTPNKHQIHSPCGFQIVYPATGRWVRFCFSSIKIAPAPLARPASASRHAPPSLPSPGRTPIGHEPQGQKLWNAARSGGCRLRAGLFEQMRAGSRRLVVPSARFRGGGVVRSKRNLHWLCYANATERYWFLWKAIMSMLSLVTSLATPKSTLRD